MNHEQLGHIVRRVFDEVTSINATKGHEYATEADALANFKTRAADAGITPDQAWLVFFGKHLDAIKSYVRTGAVMSEPIQGRIIDAVLYLILLLGLIEERENAETPAKWPPFAERKEA